MVGNVLRVYFPQFKLCKKEAIFGDIKTTPDSVINTMLLLAKQFIWKQKFGSKKLDETSFKIYMKNELNFLYQTMDFKGKNITFFNEWEVIFKHFEV